jgi:hypothetical protein
VTVPPAQIAAGQSATFTVTFTPTVRGPRRVRIIIMSNDPNEREYSFDVQGIGV